VLTKWSGSFAVSKKRAAITASRAAALVVLATLALVGTADAFEPPDTYNLQVITGEGHQVTATWQSSEPSHFHCWLSGKRRLPCAPVHFIDGLPPGTYQLHVRAFGIESGLQGTKPTISSFTIPPSVPPQANWLTEGTFG
jgi:hypothetical protein